MTKEKACSSGTKLSLMETPFLPERKSNRVFDLSFFMVVPVSEMLSGT